MENLNGEAIIQLGNLQEKRIFSDESIPVSAASDGRYENLTNVT